MRSRRSRLRRFAAGLTVAVLAAQLHAQLPETVGSGLAPSLNPLQQPESSESTSRTRTFPLTGITITEKKEVDPKTGQVTFFAVDQQGRPVSVAAVAAAEMAARSANPAAKLHPDLRDALSDFKHPVPIVVWLSFDSDMFDAFAHSLRADLPDNITKPEVERLELAMTEFVLSQNAEIVNRGVEVLESVGLLARQTSTTAPVIFTTANVEEVLALAARPEVDTIYLEKAEEQDHNTSANGTHRTTTPYAEGIRGAGIRVAMLEDNGLDPSCPHLAVAGWYFNIFGITFPDRHIHGTAGCVASRLATRRGAAPDVSLFSANAFSYSDSDITAAADWIVTRNIDVTNMSYGGGYNGVLQYKDRYFDYQSRYFWDSYVASAGNSGGKVGSPGTAWNCITVGSFEDNNSTSWTGDVMSGFSDFQNPNSGCEKPNLAAVGNVDTLGDAPNNWLTNGYTGTSFSAPFVTGNLALAMSRDSTALISPEAAMALMMATAWHNIEGASRLSDRDGAGGLHGRAAVRAAQADRARFVSLTPSSFTTSGQYAYNIYLTGGDTARVCIAWSARANASYSSTVLDADLDLTVRQGYNTTTGAYMGGSLSFNNTFEIVEFTPPTTGYYTILINDYRFNGSSEGVGISWTQRNQQQGT